MPSFVIDGNWFDMATLAVAALYSAGRAAFARTWRIESVVSDVSYGVSIFPMLMLTLTVVSSTATQTLMQGNKIIMSLAGLISLIVILRRSFERPINSKEFR